MQQVLFISSLFLFICYAFLILYYTVSWINIPVVTLSIINHQPLTKLSIVIPARNEEKNIHDCLTSIINQSYPKELYEIIVVDDHSTDSTTQIVQSFTAPNIKLLALKDFIGKETNAYKKKGIEAAISQANGTLIITTDADCTAPENWLLTIAYFFEKYQPELIVMPVAIDCNNKILETFQAIDFMMLQGITGSAVHKKIHSMCNGANLAYTKKAFEAVNGFEGINSIASGDDMLLMHKIKQKFPSGIHYIKSKDVIVQTQASKTVAEFLNQRIRWASKADKYQDKRLFPVLLIVYLFNVTLFVLPILALFKNSSFTIFQFTLTIFGAWACLMFLKIIVELSLLIPVAKFFHKQSLLFLFPFFQPVHILYTILAGWLGKFGNYQWKDRKVK